MKYIFWILYFLIISLSAIILYPVYAHAETQSEYLHSLSQCESLGRPDITILDSNNKFSYGEFQFQFSTFSFYTKKYGILPQDFSDSDTLLLIHNSYIQRALVSDMLTDGLSYNWKTCSKKIGVPYPSG